MGVIVESIGSFLWNGGILIPVFFILRAFNKWAERESERYVLRTWNGVREQADGLPPDPYWSAAMFMEMDD